ncbi:hypothetical protein PTUN_a0779 [Pseudoalteromonas tunicata]|uniref:Uncharacterized protein n=1 Tax=Pseudoalteromonas tunicata D2 TaxID=87626 RepID=A4C8U7_9GAMM|nr:hypothetical protein PTUN_a0779 [Pseudoalteromonas tunicata]EAR29012.1 hypothetical protein PTD2_08209 [Pseudoalteromonas tunicata D2]
MQWLLCAFWWRAVARRQHSRPNEANSQYQVFASTTRKAHCAKHIYNRA